MDYKLKEEILRKVRNIIQLSYGGSDVHIYHDLYSITLQHRKDLKPLLDTLRYRGIYYCWKFPFSLSASTQGCSVLLRVPEDLQLFCDSLGILVMDMPNWYAEFRHTPTKRDMRHEEPMDAQDTQFHRQ